MAKQKKRHHMRQRDKNILADQQNHKAISSSAGMPDDSTGRKSSASSHSRRNDAFQKSLKIQETSDPFRQWHLERIEKSIEQLKTPLGNPVTYPDYEQLMKLDADYVNRPHIHAIEDPRLKAAVIQVEKDLDLIECPYGYISQVVVNHALHAAYGRAKATPECVRQNTFSQPIRQRMQWVYEMNIQRPGLSPDQIRTGCEHFYSMPWTIEVSPMLLEKSVPMESLYETLMHEYLHTVIGSRGHDRAWTSNAANCSKIFGIHITRTSQVEEKGVEDQIEDSARYILECQSCGKKTYRFRSSKLIEHPEYYRCGCGGQLKLIKGHPPAPASTSGKPAAADPVAAAPYLLECTSCHRQFPRQVMSKTVKNPEQYRCPCGGSLKRIR